MCVGAKVSVHKKHFLFPKAAFHFIEREFTYVCSSCNNSNSEKQTGTKSMADNNTAEITNMTVVVIVVVVMVPIAVVVV